VGDGVGDLDGMGPGWFVRIMGQGKGNSVYSKMGIW
jgi:hypothetical protein